MMVMRKIRKSVKWMFYAVAIAFIGFIFLEWGMNVQRSLGVSMLQKGIVGRVNKTYLSLTDFRRVADKYRWTRNADMLAFEEMVQNVLISDLIRKRGLEMSEKELNEFIRENPPPELLRDTSFWLPDGSFDFERYRNLITNPNFRRFFEYYKQRTAFTLPRQILRLDVLNMIRPVTFEIYPEFLANYTKMKIKYTELNLEKIGITYSEEDLRRFFEENKKKFTIPFRQKKYYVFFEVSPTHRDTIEFLSTLKDALNDAKRGESFDTLSAMYNCGYIDTVFSPDAGTLWKFVKNLKENEIGGYYNIGRDYYIAKRKGKRLQILHFILMPSDETFESIREEVESFYNIAKEDFFLAVQQFKMKVESTYSDTFGGFLIHFSDRKEGRLVGPVETDYGFYLILLGKREKNIVPSFEEIKAKIESLYVSEMFAGKRFIIYNDFKNDFDKASKKYGKGVIKTGWINIKNCPEGEKFFKKIVRLKEGELSLPFEVNRKFYIVMCLKKKEPSQDEIKENFPKFQAQYFDKIRTEFYRNWLLSLRKHAKIVDYRW